MIMNFPGRTGAARSAGNFVGVMLVALIVTLPAAAVVASTTASLRSAAVVSSLDQEAAVRDAVQQQQQELLPRPNCSAPNPKLLDDQKCGPDCWTAYINPSEMFAFCGDYSKNISETPSPECCAGVLNASTYFAPRCFCRYIFMPAPHLGIIPARRLALPELCNVTKFCDICSHLKPACGSSPGRFLHSPFGVWVWAFGFRFSSSLFLGFCLATHEYQCGVFLLFTAHGLVIEAQYFWLDV